MRRAAWLLLASVTAVGVLLLFVFPARTLLAQNRQIAATEQRIDALTAESSQLQRKTAALKDPATVEQLARQRYGLVMPGERSYVILPPVAPKALEAPAVRAAVHHAHHWWQDLELWR